MCESESGLTGPVCKFNPQKLFLVGLISRNIKSIIMFHSLWNIYLCFSQTTKLHTTHLPRYNKL